jgi:hypothetical protein
MTPPAALDRSNYPQRCEHEELAATEQVDGSTNAIAITGAAAGTFGRSRQVG